MVRRLNSPNVGAQTEMWEQLMLLRAQSARLGTLHEAQVLQLKLWPRILFQTSTKETSFKTDIVEKKLVFSVVNTGKPFKPSKGQGVVRPADAPVVLDEWTKALLGGDWDVTVNVRAKTGKTAPKTFRYPARKIVKESVEDTCLRLAAQDKARA